MIIWLNIHMFTLVDFMIISLINRSSKSLIIYTYTLIHESKISPSPFFHPFQPNLAERFLPFTLRLAQDTAN